MSGPGWDKRSNRDRKADNEVSTRALGQSERARGQLVSLLYDHSFWDRQCSICQAQRASELGCGESGQAGSSQQADRAVQHVQQKRGQGPGWVEEPGCGWELKLNGKSRTYRRAGAYLTIPASCSTPQEIYIVLLWWESTRPSQRPLDSGWCSLALEQEQQLWGTLNQTWAETVSTKSSSHHRDKTEDDTVATFGE